MAEANPNARLEAFYDGVFAIALTLLIIEVGIPPATEFHDTGDFWLALRNILPSIFAFVLSFVVIFTTWVNHHACLRLIHKSTASFIYANGLLLFTVVLIPFPTTLLGEYVFTDHAAPAVVVYNAVLALQAVAWILLTGTAIGNKLTRSDAATAKMRANNRNGYFACMIYAALAIAAFAFPQAVAILTALTWVFWLVLGVRMKPEEV